MLLYLKGNQVIEQKCRTIRKVPMAVTMDIDNTDDGLDGVDATPATSRTVASAEDNSQTDVSPIGIVRHNKLARKTIVVSGGQAAA
jgi:hypothetical protein